MRVRESVMRSIKRHARHGRTCSGHTRLCWSRTCARKNRLGPFRPEGLSELDYRPIRRELDCLRLGLCLWSRRQAAEYAASFVAQPDLICGWREFLNAWKMVY
jgi:hypothetical protein